MTKNKKYFMFAALLCTLVMLVTGSFAWYLQRDKTTLNALSYETKEYGLEIVEDFVPWVNKDVQIKATGTGNVIVRTRFEEFIQVSGKNAGTELVSAIYKAKDITDVTEPSGNDARVDDSSVSTDLIDLYFGEKFITIEEWKAMTSGVTGIALSELYDTGYWVIDTDGWCYYTKSLAADEITNLSLSNALLEVTDKELDEKYDAPVNVDYHINVRVQAISADLSDYGSTTDKGQWTYTDGGREIIDDTDNEYEILENTPVVAGSDADVLIRGISVGGGTISYEGYSMSLNMADQTATINGFAATTKAITDVPGYNETTKVLTMPTTVDYNENEYTVTTIGYQAFYRNTMLNQIELVLPKEIQNILREAFSGSKITGTLIIPKTTLSLVHDCFAFNETLNEIIIEGSQTSTRLDGEAETLSIGLGIFYQATGVTEKLILPARTSSIGNHPFGGISVDIYYPDTLGSNTSYMTELKSGVTGQTIPYAVETDTGEYGASIIEDFAEWINKDVTVQATGMKETIVRIRFEEFLSVIGKEQSLDTESAIYIPTTLSTVETPEGNDARTDSSSLSTKLVDLYFGDKFITMEEWKNLTSGKAGVELAELYEAGYWVIDTDGWCYYTKAIAGNEVSNLSMSNAKMHISENTFDETYGKGAKLDYHVNVRLQAISADLAEYGSLTDNIQWTCTDGGRLIDEDYSNDYEILTDTPITEDADKLVTLVANTAGNFKTTPYTYTITAQAGDTPAYATITGFNLTDNSVINNMDGYDWQTNTLTMPTTITDNGTEYMVARIGASAFNNSSILTSTSYDLVLPQQLKRIEEYAFLRTNTQALVIPKTVEYLGLDCLNGNMKLTSLSFEGSTTTTLLEGEVASLEVERGVFYGDSSITGTVTLPARTKSLGLYLFNSAKAIIRFPSTATYTAGTSGTFQSATAEAYTPTTP